MSEITLTAPDISCDHCKRTIEGDLGRVEGVRSVVVEPADRTVHVTYDESAVTAEAIRDTLEEIGYPPLP